jgi:hypothetical protein
MIFTACILSSSCRRALHVVENFLILFSFDLTEIVFYDNTKQYIKPEYPVLLQKPKLIVRKNKSYKIDYNNKVRLYYQLMNK